MSGKAGYLPVQIVFGPACAIVEVRLSRATTDADWDYWAEKIIGAFAPLPRNHPETTQTGVNETEISG